MDLVNIMGDLEIVLAIFAMGFTLSAFLSGLGLMMRSGMGFMKNIVGTIIALIGSIILVMTTLLFSSLQALIIVAFGCFTIGLLITLITLLPKLMKTMQNACLYMYHISHMLMAFMSCLALVIITYW